MTEKLKRSKFRRKVAFFPVCFLVLVSSLCNCSGIGTKQETLYPSWGERKKIILSWAASEKNKVDRGILKDSEYWKQFYQKSMKLRPDLDDFLCYANEMIKVSRIFEEGRITKEQFDAKQRQLAALLAMEENRRAARMNSLGVKDQEEIAFTLRSGSFFSGYFDDLRGQIRAAGPQFSISQCAFFDDSIECTTQNPSF